MEIVRVQQQALIEKRLFYAPVITARILSTYWRDMILVRNRAEPIRLERIPQRTELREQVRRPGSGPDMRRGSQLKEF